MATPFPANATLTFKALIASTEIDERGNPAGVTALLAVTAYLKRVSNQGRTDEQLQGGEIARLPMEGRIDVVSFQGEEFDSLPASIKPGAVADAVISDPAGISPDITGQFYLEIAPASAFGTSGALGAPIKGFLLVEVAWAEAL